MKRLFALYLLLILPFFGPTAKPTSMHIQQHKNHKIVVSFSVIESLTNQLVHGLTDTFEIITIVPNGHDPHVFQPKTSMAKTLHDADLVILNGLGFEEWLTRFIDASGAKHKVIIASHGIKARKVLTAKNPEYDPHVWHNVAFTRIYLKRIYIALCAQFPKYASTFSKNYHTFDNDLSKLDTWVHQQWKNIPKEKRKVITTHDAFAYYGMAYDIEFISPLGLSTEQEPSVREIARLISYVKKHNITAFFAEQLSSSRLITQIARETGQKIAGTLFADSVLESKRGQSSYIRTIQYNTHELIKAIHNVN